MKHIVSTLIFSNDMSHVLLTPHGDGDTTGMPAIGCPPGEGFRSSASLVAESILNIDVNPSDWIGVHNMRYNTRPDETVHIFTTHLQVSDVRMRIEGNRPFWMPVRLALRLGRDGLLADGEWTGFPMDPVLSYLIPMAILSHKFPFRDLGY